MRNEANNKTPFWLKRTTVDPSKKSKVHEGAVFIRSQNGSRRYRTGYKLTSDGVFHPIHFEGYSFPLEMRQSGYARDERSPSAFCLEFIQGMRQKAQDGVVSAIGFFEKFPLLEN